jgi:hypothetical protein
VTTRRSMLTALVVLVVGVLVGLGLYTWGGRLHESAVRDQARAPVGCTTTLRFTETGRFWVFAERRGQLSEVPGNCAAAASWDIDGELPRLALELLGPDGEEVATVRDSSKSYDVGDFEGTSVRSAVIDEPGLYTLRVDARSGGFAVAVGRDPADAGSVLRNAGVLVAAVAVVIAVLMAFAGPRRSRRARNERSGNSAPPTWSPPAWDPPPPASPAPLPPPSAWPPNAD